MSVTQFAMVEELAFLVKDNLPCKHLVLSMEEAFINFLQDDTSSNGILDLEPMNSYNRLLLHRLADIFGFAHESIGEGEDRHLVLQRCPETSIPSILVSDILWQCDEPQSLTASRHILTREGTAPGVGYLDVKPERLPFHFSVMETNLPSFELSLEAREAAYLAARERIFAMDVGEIQEPVKHKPRTVPIVARRMIAHALGQRINSCNQDDDKGRDSKDQAQTNGPSIQDTDKADNDLRTDTCQDILLEPGENVDACSKANSNANEHNSSVFCEKNVSDEPTQKRPIDASKPSRTRNRVNKEYSKEQQLGAAKRMFANALGLRSAKDSRGGERKTVQ